MAKGDGAGLRARLNQLLDASPGLTPGQAVEALKGAGVGDADRIRKNFYNLKSDRKKAAGEGSQAKAAKAKGPKAAASKPAAAAVRRAESGAAPGTSGAATASEAVRQLEEVIRRCGGIDAVRQLLDVLERIGTR